MKRPSFQFYVGDWQSNSNLRRCTFAEKGIWLDVMCLMHDGEEYGILRWELKEIAQAVGCKLSDLKALVEKGVLKGADRNQKCSPYIYIPRSGGKDGAAVILIGEQLGPLWYSSRMVKDEYVSKNRGKGTRFGETKPTTKPDDESPPTQRVGEAIGETPAARVGDGPSTSSSFSPSGSKEDADDRGATPHSRIFSRIIEYYPELTAKDAGVIHAWLGEADVDLDILPAIDRTRAKNLKPKTFGYFTPMIAEAKQNRLSPIPNGDIYGDQTRGAKPNSVDKRLAALYRAGTGSGSDQSMEPGRVRREAIVE